MKNLWSDNDAKAAIARGRREGVGRDVALRVYTTNLLGGDARLVLHGGGNTSVKTHGTDTDGSAIDILYVKASGHDMADLGAEGLTPVRLGPLRRLVDLDDLDDEAMIAAGNGQKLDPGAANPSVEILLHAFLPQRFVDHTHANAVLALTNQTNGEALCRRLYGRRAAIFPFAMPSFALAKSVRQAIEGNPEIEGLILLRHGVFTMGDTARQAYDRMIDFVSLAERRLKQGRRPVFTPGARPRRAARAVDVVPIVRGLGGTADGPERFVLAFRGGRAVRRFVDGRHIARYACQGPATPDHVLRIKAKPLILPPPEAGRLDAFAGAAATAAATYEKDYRRTFSRCNRRFAGAKAMPDPWARIILVPGVGLFALGRSPKDAAIAADLAEANVAVIGDAEAIGRFQSLPAGDLFEVETWAPEQAKLKRRLPALAGHVVAVTGGASGIGAATARAFAAEGAAVAVLDVDRQAAEAVAGEIGGIAVACDVTERAAVERAVADICRAFGGVDIVVSNAGAAWQGRIGSVTDATLRRSFELNFWGHQNIAQATVAVMQAQGLGGCLLFNTSKQAINPGPDLGPYGVPKAATLFLMRQYALDHGADGIRANAVNADRIRTGLLTDAMIETRARARRVSREAYMAGNLLGKEVTAEDVAGAFVALARAPKTTAAVITVDGGNIAAALR